MKKLFLSVFLVIVCHSLFANFLNDDTIACMNIANEAVDANLEDNPNLTERQQLAVFGQVYNTCI